MTDTKKLEIEWDGKKMEIFVSLDPARLPGETFEQYKVRQKLMKKAEKQKKQGIPVPPGTPTRRRQKQMIKKELKKAMEEEIKRKTKNVK